MIWKRILTAAVLVPVVVAAVLVGPLWLLSGLVGVVILLALWEFFRLGDEAGFLGFVQWTTLCSLLIIYTQWRDAAMAVQQLSIDRPQIAPIHLVGGIDAVLILFILGLAIAVSMTKLDVSRRLSSTVVSAAGVILVAFPLSYLVRIVGFPDGRRFLFVLLVLIWVGDTAAFFVGRSLAKIPMAPVLSPKKTWEGAAANLLGALLVGWIAAPWLGIAVWSALVLAALANIAGQVGDLLESAYKRSAGVKDSGVLLPGHGGMLDRIDSLVLAAPVTWWFIRLLFVTGHLR